MSEPALGQTGVLKVRIRKDGRRPFTCGGCGAEVAMIAHRCPACGTTFHGWRDDTGDRGKDPAA